MFIKFGEETHLEDLMEGKLRITPTTIYQKIEQEQGQKGVGDEFDCYLSLNSTRAKSNNSKINLDFYNGKYNVICEGALTVPMFCLYHEKGEYRESLNKSDFDNLMEQLKFPQKMLIIPNEQEFLTQIQAKTKNKAFASYVRYINNKIMPSDYADFLTVGKSDITFINPQNTGKIFLL